MLRLPLQPVAQTGQRAGSAAVRQQHSEAALAVVTDASEERLDLGKKRKYDTTNRPRQQPRSKYSRSIPSDDPTQTPCCATKRCHTILQLCEIQALRDECRAAATTQAGYKAYISKFVHADSPLVSYKHAYSVLGHSVCRNFLRAVFGAHNTIIDNLRGTPAARSSANTQ